MGSSEGLEIETTTVAVIGIKFDRILYRYKSLYIYILYIYDDVRDDVITSRKFAENARNNDSPVAGLGLSDIRIDIVENVVVCGTEKSNGLPDVSFFAVFRTRRHVCVRVVERR